MIYLTFNDAPSGIYHSQVIDVVKVLNEKSSDRVRLISFISIRGLKKNRQNIKLALPEAIVLPMFPRLDNWAYNSLTLFFLSFFVNAEVVISRGVFACNLALKLKKIKRCKKVYYDGRGAIAAEFKEYDIIKDNSFSEKIVQLESKSVLESDFRIAVTEKLVSYWRDSFGYTDNKHIIIPCTLGLEFKIKNIDEILIARNLIRGELNVNETDVLLVYSGSTAGWQSFELIKKFLEYHLPKRKDISILFLSKEDASIVELKKTFPKQIFNLWLEHSQVQQYLWACDYGILVREQSITNRVASPTKFAEYLASGLPVLISENLGDYSDFVKQHACGFLLNEKNMYDLNLSAMDVSEKARMLGITEKYFIKSSEIVGNKYIQLLRNLY